MIEIRNLCLTIGKQNILNDISLELGNNQTIVILGENGSGKSSFFNSMLDIRKNRYQGEIVIDGKNIQEMNAREIARKVTFNFQIKPDSDAYVYEMLTLARSPYKGFSVKLDKEEEERVNEAVAMTGIEALLDRKLNTLSGGERQMVYLAMSIIQNTEYMLFDEPNTYLDTENQHRLMDILKELKNEGHTLVVSLHSIDMAFALADVIYILADGKISGKISRDEFESEHVVEEAFKVRKMVFEDDGEKVFVFR